MLIEILDDFDLEKIALRGQCFRVKRMQDDGYRFIFGDEVLYIREIGNHRFSVSCSLDAFFGVIAGQLSADILPSLCNRKSVTC